MLRAPAPRRSVPASGLVPVIALVAALVAGCAASGSAPSFVMVPAITPVPLGVRDTDYAPDLPAPALRLTDQDGRPFDLASRRGTPVFVYFGYTHCPDVCPTTLADLRAGIAAAGVQAQVVFVTIDPARDDAAAMKRYVDFYAAGFIGLTGTDAEIAAAASAWGVGYHALSADSNGNYPMSHTTDSYLVDASGMLRHHVFFGAPTDLIARLLRAVSG